jgi:hypothetical protein
LAEALSAVPQLGTSSGKRRLGQHEAGHEQRRLHRQVARAGRQQVARDHPPPRRPGGHRRQHVLLTRLGPHDRPDATRHPWPAERDEDRGEHRGDRRQRQHQRQHPAQRHHHVEQRQHDQHVAGAQHRTLDHAAGRAGPRAQPRADEQRAERRHQGQAERGARAVQRARQHVASEAVGAEQQYRRLRHRRGPGQAGAPRGVGVEGLLQPID